MDPLPSSMQGRRNTEVDSESCGDCQATIRVARVGDAERIARLCRQLGYPVSSEEARRRLERIHQEDRHVVYVAELADGQLVGWVHVYAGFLVVVDLHAEIGGLVVDEGHRGCGIGKLLMRQAEEWARGQGCWTVYLRSNAIRTGAHAFYKRIGYSVIKTSLTFYKALRSTSTMTQQERN
jgi:GNAT superfamily N-acetyltransferase